MPNYGCNLECVKDNKGDEEEIVEFVGPVKIILVDQPKTAYRHKVWNAAFIVLAQMLIAITFLLLIFYSLSYKKNNYKQALHIFLSTVGLQLSLPTGVLTMNNLNGAAAPMTLGDRRFEHGIMQIFGLGTTVAGAILSYFSGYPNFITIHSCIGFAAIGLAFLNAIVGIVLYISFVTSSACLKKLNHFFVTTHNFLGILTIVVSSTCLLCGIVKDSFIDWLPFDEIYYVVGISCVYYTIIVIYKSLVYVST